jgi:hypothetical protein
MLLFGEKPGSLDFADFFEQGVAFEVEEEVGIGI